VVAGGWLVAGSGTRSCSSIVVPELLEPEVYIACAVDVLQLLGTQFVLPNVGLVVDRVPNSIDLSIESLLDLFFRVDYP